MEALNFNKYFVLPYAAVTSKILLSFSLILAPSPETFAPILATSSEIFAPILAQLALALDPLVLVLVPPENWRRLEGTLLLRVQLGVQQTEKNQGKQPAKQTMLLTANCYYTLNIIKKKLQKTLFS